MPDAISRLSELSDDELDALIDIAQARAEGALTRRDLLKMGGGLAAAGVLGGSAVGSAAADASTSDGDWNLGEPGNRGDVFADGVNSNSISTDGVELWVDPQDGDDSNSGLDESEPTATINGALRGAPVHGDTTGAIVIRVSAGTVTDPTHPVDLEAPPANSIYIIGETDGSGNPTTVLDAGGSNNGVRALGPFSLRLQNLEVTGAVENVRYGRNCYLSLLNCLISADGTTSDFNVNGASGGYLLVDSDSVVDATGATGLSANIHLTSGANRIEGEVVGTGGSVNAVLMKQRAYLITGACRIDAAGNGVCIKATDQTNVKIGNGGTYENARRIVRAERSSDWKFQNFSTLTVNNVDFTGSIPQGSQFNDESLGESIMTLPKSDGEPTNFPPPTDGASEGAIRYDTATQGIVFRDGSQKLSAGHEVLASGTDTIPSGSTAVVGAVPLGKPNETVFTHTPSSTDGARVEKRKAKNSGSDEDAFIFEETTGTGDAEIDWWVLEYKLPE